MKLAILGAPDSWYVHDLARAGNSAQQVVVVPFSRLSASVESTGIRVASRDVVLNDMDAVLVRTMPAGSLEQVVFRMDALGALVDAGVAVVNPPRAIEVAVDKYLTSCRLQKAGIRTPRTMLCQHADDAVQAFHLLGGDVVLKPVFGGEGKGITRLNDEGTARRVFQLLVSLGATLYLQQFIPHEGYDLRLLVVGQHVLGIRRSNPGDWRTNVSRGATAQPERVTDDLRRLALQCAQVVGAPLAGVDLLPGRDGHLHALEVNAVPGWRALSQCLSVDVAAMVWTLLEDLAAGRLLIPADILPPPNPRRHATRP